MCHLVLALPFVGLLLFLVLPFGEALAYYLPLAAISLLVYFLIFEGMKKPVITGREGMIGSRAEVISAENPTVSGQCVVRCEGELWQAISMDNRLAPGDEVKVLAFKGMRLVVRRDYREGESSGRK